ncbi:MAG: lysophospholipid acyltransferase family protein [Candidatus Omnitrophota bacterium]|nr:lysophospholipid acyltransferase family protein [Candidatus Omnitrophota bacterium]
MIKQGLVSSIIWAAGIALTILLYFAMLFFSVALFPFDKKRKVAHAQCFWWADALIALNPYWQLRVSGFENIDRKKTYVIVANHQSLADIIIVYKTKMQFKWVAKESLFKVPFVGWSMSLAKHVKLKRGDFSSIKKVYKEAAKWLRSGMSVLFFPEGTRSTTGDMKDFQNGAFKLAIKERVPILPISIRGTGNIMPKGGRLFNTKMPVSIKVLPEIDTTTFQAADFARLRDLVRAMLEAA